MRTSGFRGKHLLTWEAWDSDSIATVLTYAHELKRCWATNDINNVLAGQTIQFLSYQEAWGFEHLLTLAASQLGAHVASVPAAMLQHEFSKNAHDIGLVLSRLGDSLVCCHDQFGIGHETLSAISEHATVPVIGGMSDQYAPVQAMADLMMIREIYGSQLKGLKLALVWVYGNNASRALGIPHSLLQLVTRMGVDVSLANPPEFPLLRSVVHQAKNHCQLSGGKVKRCETMEEALEGAQIIYPVHWGGCAHIENYTGDETQLQILKAHNERYTAWKLDQNRVCLSDFDARVLHPLPFERDRGVDSEVLDGPSSKVIDQAENRLHVLKAVLALTMAGR
ncbi:hypothetical protein JW960_26615 [candidate division KSB1 bacterium]|nr:hypothetical protein [candidate division KSB1 bacterium]